MTSISPAPSRHSYITEDTLSSPGIEGDGAALNALKGDLAERHEIFMGWGVPKGDPNDELLLRQQMIERSFVNARERARIERQRHIEEIKKFCTPFDARSAPTLQALQPIPPNDQRTLALPPNASESGEASAQSQLAQSPFGMREDKFQSFFDSPRQSH